MSQSQRRVGYYLAFMDPGRDSLIVVDVPPASDDHVLNGRLCNIWQVPLEDVGKFGADEGRGARYLLLPPGLVKSVRAGYWIGREVAVRSGSRNLGSIRHPSTMERPHPSI